MIKINLKQIMICKYFHLKSYPTTNVHLFLDNINWILNNDFNKILIYKLKLINNVKRKQRQ